MNSSTIYKTLSKLFYSGGVVFLLTGMLLSLVSQPGYAASPTPDPRLAATPKGVVQPGKQAPKPDAPQTGSGAPVVVQPTRVVSAGQSQPPKPVNKPVSQNDPANRAPIIGHAPTLQVASGGAILSLDFICGYTQDPTINWRAWNHTNQAITFTWTVLNNGQTGTATAPPNNQVIFATTTTGVSTTVQISGNGVVYDTSVSGTACKQYLVITFACIQGTNTIAWSLTNPNTNPDFDTDVFTWSLDNPPAATGSGSIPINTTLFLTNSPGGSHTLSVTWSEPVLGPRTISLSSNVGFCMANTNTPTATSTASATPTNTSTSTPTNTPTNTSTSTPTNTPTNTPTGTLTATATDPSTPTSTSTQSILTATFTASPTASKTVPPPPPVNPTDTPTSTVTAPPPPPGGFPTPTITSTPGGVIIPNTGADLVGPGSITELMILAGLLFLGIGLILSALIKRVQTK